MAQQHRSSTSGLHSDHDDVGPEAITVITPGTPRRLQIMDEGQRSQENGLKDFVDPAGDRYNPKTAYEAFKLQLIIVLDHIGFRIFTVLLILVDVVIIIIDLCGAGNPLAIEILSLIICSYFMVEVVMRIIARGAYTFFHNWVDVVDCVIVVISFVFTAIYTGLDMSNVKNVSFARLIVVGRLVRIVLIARLITEKKHASRAARLVVSQNKRRYQLDGFDLDLCYVTDRVIAMSFPSTGIMALYRNPIHEVARFFNTKHPGHYRIYNLCSERMYNEELFHNQVIRIRIDDHCVPKLEEMVEFVKNAHEWIDADPKNIIAVHCKGGKGRTGTMICTWLVENGTFDQAAESLDYFGSRRTDKSVGSKFQGVETPSQSRYVGYFEQIKKNFNGELPPEQPLILKTVKVHGLSTVGYGDGSDLSFSIYLPTYVWEYNIRNSEGCTSQFDPSTSTLTVELKDAPRLVKDVKIMFQSIANIPKGYEKCPFYFCFNTSFVKDNKLHLTREELDNPHKPKTWNVFREDFGVTLEFEPAQ